ncbi:MAG: efflux RND transporter permease subunit, partial [Planctomycetota bacterium]
MGLLEAFVRNPVKVIVGALLLALFGTIALIEMPMQLTPEVETPTITIETAWRGASPQEVEREIVQEQEEQLKGVPGLRKLSSECMDSLGRLTLEFLVGTDMATAMLEVTTRLQQVPEYPEEADEPVVKAASSGDQAVAWIILRPRVVDADEIAAFQKEHPELAEALEPARRAHNSGLRLYRLKLAAEEHEAAKELLPREIDVPGMRRFAEDYIEARFERVPGVSNSNLFGGKDEEVRVVVDPDRLAARGITFDQLRRALRARNVDTSAGDYWEGKRRYVVRTLGQLRSVEEVEGVLLARRDDVPVYVRDVARVELGYKKPSGVVRNFGTPCIAVNCIRETGANVLEVMEGIRSATRELNKTLLAERGLVLEQVYDETEYIYSAVGLVQQNILIGGALTILVLLLFLRSARSTLVIAVAIPTSIIGTFLFLGILGRSLNVVSLAGLAFAVGMLVDNAVVVLENIYRHYQMGARRFVAAVEGAKEVWGAVIASTLTTLAVFLPVLFVEEQAGQLFRDIALAISFSVGLSLLVSVTLIPMMTARILSKRNKHADEEVAAARAAKRDTLFVRTVVGINAWLQRGILRQLAFAVLIIAVAVSLSVVLLPKAEYLPTGRQNLVFGIVLPPPGYNLDELVKMGERIENGLKPYWSVDPDSPEARALEYPAVSDFFFVAFGRQVFLGVRAHDPLRAGELIPVIEQIAGSLEGVYAFASQLSIFEQGLSAGRTIDIEITGPELTHLISLGGRIMGAAMQAVPGRPPRPIPSLDLANPEVHIVPKWEQAADLQVSAAELGYMVDCLVDGGYATDYFAGGDKIDITIVGDERYADRLQDLKGLTVATPSGHLVPLSALATVRLSSGPEQINHRERERAITIQVAPPPTTALEEAMDAITE